MSGTTGTPRNPLVRELALLSASSGRLLPDPGSALARVLVNEQHTELVYDDMRFVSSLGIASLRDPLMAG
ncbi:hypothetical protein [Streptomyces caeruleatus]|uniref:Uncharacterized protein n=1 Tax=Streptomyces caeruleatus TaxID=661399 RepID=A0A101U359_9ACTN|nr:hypothetical protein [Streptomyces caeruleatus]KUO03254.1 hypothetical protein AQJ67_16085 [Streptomyces caeruleatus]